MRTRPTACHREGDDPMTDDKFTVQAAVDGKLQLSDLRMDPATLAYQAVVAEDDGNPQLAENFLRAAELATLDGDEVMSLYEALRPHRSTVEELEALQTSLEARGAARCAELVGQAAAVYARRGLLR
jgi:propanediol dehydratase small subunit